jgi:predicted heme/steroid binding protein
MKLTREELEKFREITGAMNLIKMNNTHVEMMAALFNEDGEYEGGDKTSEEALDDMANRMADIREISKKF